MSALADQSIAGEYIEKLIDEYIENLTKNNYNKKKNVKLYFKVHGIKKSDCKSALQGCLKFRNELDCILIDKDPDLIEGYSYLTMSKIKKLRAFIDSLCCDLESYSKVVRKKKKYTPEQMLKKFKYLSETSDGTIVSFEASRIFDADSFIAYNIKTCELFYYKTSNKFEVKGTTLLGFDEKLSYSVKVGRRGMSFIRGLTEGTTFKVEKQLNMIGTKKKRCTGRFNLNTILLRVLK